MHLSTSANPESNLPRCLRVSALGQMVWPEGEAGMHDSDRSISMGWLHSDRFWPSAEDKMTLVAGLAASSGAFGRPLKLRLHLHGANQIPSSTSVILPRQRPSSAYPRQWSCGAVGWASLRGLALRMS